MMLDLTTLYVVAGLMLAAVTAMFVLEVVRRGVTPVDRIWTLALGSAFATALCYGGAAASPELWWFVGLGNAASALTTFALWSGLRAYDERRPLLGLGAAAATLCLLVTTVQGPAGGEWAGGGVMIAATGTGAALAAVASMRGRMRRVPSGTVLSIVLVVVSVYQALRFVLYVVHGPRSATFATYAGTEQTTLLESLLVVVAAIVMILARYERVREQRRRLQAFDPMSGARTATSFDRRGSELLAQARRSARPVVVVSVIVQNVPQLVAAFGRDCADRAVVSVGERCVEAVPHGSMVGRAERDGSFDVLLVGTSATDAVTWAETLRKDVIAAPLPVRGGHVRLSVSAAVLPDSRGTESLADLCADARQRAQQAVALGGNRVVAGTGTPARDSS